MVERLLCLVSAAEWLEIALPCECGGRRKPMRANHLVGPAGPL